MKTLKPAVAIVISSMVNWWRNTHPNPMPVNFQDSVKYLLAGHVSPPMFFLVQRLKKLRAHGWGRGKRNDQRYSNGRAQGDRKFPEQPSDNTSHH